MEPVTHILTGACLARSGLNRRAAYATLTMAAAAEFPDIDTLWAWRGPVESFQHHRGITHTFLGLPFEAALLVAVVYLLHRGLMARAERTKDRVAAGSDSVPGRAARSLTSAPVRWGTLYGLALLALLSHLLLDYTNNYGLRPFYPFDPHWYAASIVFIFDPLIFVMLLGGLVTPALFGLVNSEIGAKAPAFRSPGWAIAALTGVIMLWGFREYEHSRALQLALSQSIAEPQGAAATSAPKDSTTSADATLSPPASPATYLSARRAWVSPDPLNPFHWPSVIDFGPVYQLAEIDSRNQTVTAGQILQPKPPRTPAVLAAEASPLGRVYMDWSPMPFISQSGAGPAEVNDSITTDAGLNSPLDTVVLFRDPRFMGPVLLLHSAGTTPLTARVTVNAAGQAVRQTLDGREEP